MTDKSINLNQRTLNSWLSCNGQKMDKKFSTSIGQCSGVSDDAQEFQAQECPDYCSLIESNSDYMCNLCNKSFAKQRYLNDHVRIHANRSHICQICSRLFNLKSNLNKHLLTHKGEKSHVCKICSKRFTTKGNLNQHILTHTGEKSHVCEICNKSFMQKVHLKDHLLTHSGEKPHTCHICKRSFNRKENMKVHLLTHSGEKPHVCEICDKSFLQKSSLKTHMLTHSSEKPHVCNICNKSFAQKGSLNVHLVTHSGEKPYECNICNKTFGRKCYLDRHLIRHDKMNHIDLSLYREEEPPSTSEKSKNVNSDFHLPDASELSHRNNQSNKLQVKEEIDYMIKEEHDISNEENFGIDEIWIKSDGGLQEMSCDVKEENIPHEVNDNKNHDMDNEILMN